MTAGIFVFMLKDLELLVCTWCDKHLGHRRKQRGLGREQGAST